MENPLLFRWGVGVAFMFLSAFVSASIDEKLLGIDLNKIPFWKHIAHKVMYMAIGGIIMSL